MLLSGQAAIRCPHLLQSKGFVGIEITAQMMGWSSLLLFLWGCLGGSLSRWRSVCLSLFCWGVMRRIGSLTRGTRSLEQEVDDGV